MNRSMLFMLIIMVMMVSAPLIVTGQVTDQNRFERPTTSQTIMRSWDYHVQLQNESPFRELVWRNVGPTRQGGRVSSIDCPAGDSSTIFVTIGTAGIWKTQDDGKNWEQLFTHEATFALGDLAIAESDPDILWAGSGEGAPPRSGYAGCGVFKSTDGGKSWDNMGLHDTQHIGRIVIDPKNPDIVYVAALGHVYSSNRNRGLYKTIDGGQTWKKTLFIDNRTGVIDVVMDPEDSQILYAAAWEQMRHAWDYESGGDGSGIYKTTDGGATWREITEGLPQGDGVGRIGLAVAPSNPDVVYAGYLDVGSDSGEPGVYRSDDKGESWRKVSEERMSSGIWYYFGDVRVSPDNEDQVYVLALSLQRSDDGGKTFTSIGRGTHSDHHALWIDPKNPDRILNGNDGGFYISDDRGETFEHINNMSVGEFYAISVDMAKPYNIYGGLQDNGCMMGSSDQEVRYDQEDGWRRTGGGDGFVTFVDPSDSSIIYTESQFGAFRRNGGQGRGSAPREAGMRKNWMSPYIISAHNPSVLYFGANKLFKSLDKGSNWECISDDMSKFRPDRQGNVPHATLTTVSESPIRQGVIYAGTDDGNVWVTPDDGASWELITRGLPDLWVSRVAASNFEVGTVYVTLTGYREDNFKPYVFKSIDFGRNWKSIESNLPVEAINVVCEDPHRKDTLYVGTELGVYATLDGGANWASLCGALPTMPVHDLVVHPRENDLIIGTHARGVWILDDLETVQGFAVEDLEPTERPMLYFEEEEEIGVEPLYVPVAQREVAVERLVQVVDQKQQVQVQQQQVVQQRVDFNNLSDRQRERVRLFWERDDVMKFFEKQDMQSFMLQEDLRKLYEAGDLDGLMAKLEVMVQEDKAKVKVQQQAVVIEAEIIVPMKRREIREVYRPRQKTIDVVVIEEQVEADKPKKAKVREIREIYPGRGIQASEIMDEHEIMIREIREVRMVVIRSEEPAAAASEKRVIREIREIQSPREIARAGIIVVAEAELESPEFTAEEWEYLNTPSDSSWPLPQAQQQRQDRFRVIQERRDGIPKKRVIRERRDKAPPPKREIREVRYPIPVKAKVRPAKLVSNDLKKNDTISIERTRSWERHVRLRDESQFKDLQWRNVGPTFCGGLITSIVGTPGLNTPIYAASGTGGLWKSTNEGKSWVDLFTYESTFAIGDIEVCQSDPDVIWVGSGEDFMSRSSYAGMGVYKTTNGGDTWRNMGLAETHTIGRVVIDPEDSDVVYVAAIGHNFTFNSERGVYKTTNGGRSWDKCLFISDKIGIVDLVMDPSDNDILYAAAWDRERGTWENRESGIGSAIYKTTDRGDSWDKLEGGFARNEYVGRIGLDISVSNPNVVYALVDDQDPENKGAVVYRSDDKGATWIKSHDGVAPRVYGGNQGYLYGDIRVAPDDENRIYILGVNSATSADGGITFEPFARSNGIHVDHHSLWIDPSDTSRILMGNDGGMDFTYDGGETWTNIVNLPLAEFYMVSVDMAKPYNIYGGLQDNGCVMGPSDHNPWITDEDAWRSTAGADGFYSYLDPAGEFIYTASQFGNVRRTSTAPATDDNRRGRSLSITPRGPEGERQRRNWMSPYIISAHNPSILYYGSQVLFKSMNKGGDWTAISGDLTTDPENQGDVPWGTITTIDESPLRVGLLYVGTDDGKIHVTKDGGESWREITGLPNKWVSRVTASSYDVGTVYVTLTGFRNDDFSCYVYVSTDFGKTFESLKANLPDESVNVIREDPKKRGVLYLGTDMGVYVSLDQGRAWQSLCNDLPTIPVHDLVIQPRENDLVIGTHGRSIWIMDIDQIQQKVDG
ncbi:MAG: hypothetical protein GY869_00440 [Planctomycetes bacterium]|nr:hypothetical protein [Planctomycetota bacterium]